MWRLLLLPIFGVILLAAPGPARAAGPPFIAAWEVCRGEPVAGGPPRLTDCRPAPDIVDPQGREVWLRGLARPKTVEETSPSALYVYGATSAEAWFNGVRLGANGQPGPTAEAERPGRYA